MDLTNNKCTSSQYERRNNIGSRDLHRHRMARADPLESGVGVVHCMEKK